MAPKRAKGPKVKIPSSRVQKHSSTAKPTAPKEAPKEVTTYTQPSWTRRNPGRVAAAQVTDLSEDSEGIVQTTTRSIWRRAQVNEKEEEVYMSGALGGGDRSRKPKSKEGLEELRVERRKRRQREFESVAIDRVGGANKAILDIEGTLQVASPAPEDATGASQASPRTLRKGRLGPENAPIPDSLQPVQAQDNQEESLQERPVAASTLPDLLLSQADASDALPSADDMSVVNNSRGPTTNAQESLNHVEPEADFQPEDESTTPYNVTKSQNPILLESPLDRSQLGPSKGHKRKSSDMSSNIPSSPPLLVPEDSMSSRPGDIEGLSGREQGPSPSSQRPAKRSRNEKSDDDGTMVPPMSSSPLASFNEPFTAASLTKVHCDQSRSKKTTRSCEKGQKPARTSVSTATLQALLPQRRRRRMPAQDDFDLSSDESATDTRLQEHLLSSDSEISEDDDDVDHNRIGKKSRKASKPSKATALPRKVRKSSLQTPSTEALEARRRTALTSRTTLKTPSKTYAQRRTSSDKENNSLVDSSHNESLNPVDDASTNITGQMGERDHGKKVTEPPKRAKKELRALMDKFKKIDSWDLDFEDVSPEVSQMKDAR